MNFQSLGLKPELIRAVTEMGFETPMPIQEQAIPVLMTGNTDFVGLAQTGTGKTGAYGLALLQRIDTACHTPQALILCPTRELCMQITGELRQFGLHLKGFKVVAVYGGAMISAQISEIRRGVQVVVATPGRLCDLMRRKALNLSGVAIAVLDEADEMLNMGFKEDLDLILEAMPEDVSTWLFSATMQGGVAAIARKYLNKPFEITIGTRNQSAANLTHIVYLLQRAHRYVALKRLLDVETEMFGLIFRRTRREAQELADALVRDGYPAEALHGDLSQSQRDSVMRHFRNRQVHLLIATDVAARGLDIDDITHVIHYDLPDDLEVYTHRSGRTARAGKSGVSVVFASPSESYRLRQLEHTLRIRFTIGKVPDGREACRRILLAMAKKLADTDVVASAIADYLPPVAEVFQLLSKDQLVAHLVAAEVKHYHATHGTTTDINAVSNSPARINTHSASRTPHAPHATPHAPHTPHAAPRATHVRRPADGPMHRFQIDIGRRDRANEGAIVRMVCENAGIQSSTIGRIAMEDTVSFFDVQEQAVEQVRSGLRQARFDGRPVAVRDALASGPAGERMRPGPAHGPNQKAFPHVIRRALPRRQT